MAAEPEQLFKSDRSERKKESQFNFNTVVSAVVLGVIMWVGNKTQNTSESVTKIETTLPYMTASVTELKTQIGQLVTRAEMEARFADMNQKNAAVEQRLMKLEYEKRKPEQ